MLTMATTLEELRTPILNGIAVSVRYLFYYASRSTRWVGRGD